MDEKASKSAVGDLFSRLVDRVLTPWRQMQYERDWGRFYLEECRLDRLEAEAAEADPVNSLSYEEYSAKTAEDYDARIGQLRFDELWKPGPVHDSPGDGNTHDVGIDL